MQLWSRGEHIMGIPMGPMWIPWEWELLDYLDRNRKGNGNQVIGGGREWVFCFLGKFPHHLIRVKFTVIYTSRIPSNSATGRLLLWQLLVPLLWLGQISTYLLYSSTIKICIWYFDHISFYLLTFCRLYIRLVSGMGIGIGSLDGNGNDVGTGA